MTIINKINSLASLFTGKGGTLKLTIAGSLVCALIYEILDSRYKLNVTCNNCVSVSLSPFADGSATDSESSAAPVTPADKEADQDDDESEDPESEE